MGDTTRRSRALRSWVAMLVLLVALAPFARAAETVPEAANRVIAAHEAGASLGDVAGDCAVDPWLVTLELCARRRGDLARAYISAGEFPEGVAIDVQATRGYTDDLRGALDSVRSLYEHVAAGRTEAAREALAGLGEPTDPRLQVLDAEARATVARLEGDLDLRRRQRTVAAETAESIGWLVRAAANWETVGHASLAAGDTDGAVAAWRRQRAVHQRRGDAWQAATALGNCAVVLGRADRHAEAVPLLRRMKAELETAAPDAMQGQLGVHLRYELAGALMLDGEPVEAETLLAEAVDLADEPELAGWRDKCAVLWARALLAVGRTSRAARELDRIRTELAGDELGGDEFDGAGRLVRAQALAALGTIAEHRRDWATAAEHYRRAGADFARLGRERDVDRASVLAAQAELRAGMHGDAVASLASLLTRVEERGDGPAQGAVHRLLAEAAIHGGDLDAARDHVARAAQATAAASAPQSRLLQTHAELRLAHATEAWDDVRALARLHLGQLRQALTQGHTVGAAELQDWLTGPDADLAALAVRDSGDVATLYEVMELRRAQGLLSALANRSRLRRAAVPTALQSAAADAREQAARAYDAYRDAVGAGDLSYLRAAWTGYEDARDAAVLAERRIHEAARRDVAVEVPEPARPEAVAALLGSDEALVLCGSAVEEDRGWAVVLPPDGAPRLVDLPSPSTWAKSLQAAVGPVVEALGETTGRVFVAPAGALYGDDLERAFGSRQVVRIPSATVWARLHEEAGKPGTGVLALGDPAYDLAATDGGSRAAGRRTRRPRLPATAAEARAVGDRLLLGEGATESALRAALADPKRGRLRAIHLACHGEFDLDAPMQSALLLLGDERNDGLLTAGELYGLRLDADLLVLSACEAGRSRVHAGEGPVGLVGAALAAGASRVLVNANHIDDASTAALVQRFYAEWKDGARTAAEALRIAQDQVRSTPRWRAPEYWAGWQLWGLE